MNWDHQENIIIGTHKDCNLEDLLNYNKIASFDLDGTIICPKSTRKFPKDRDDWKIKYDGMIDYIKRLYKEYNKIVIITNQSMLGKPDKQNDFMYKIEKIAEEIVVPFYIFISMTHDMYRKPMIGFWEKYIKNNSDNCFYCGDAAGRLPEKDFSDTDYKFALNLGIKFYTPENLLYGKDEQLYEKYPNLKYYQTNEVSIPSIADEVKMIIMVGIQGSGKTYIAKKIEGFVRISQDELKTKAKCLKICKENLKIGNKVIIDNTNPSKKVREEYINIANQNNVHCCCIWMTTPFDISKHNTHYRHLISNGESAIIPDIAYNIYKKNFEKPEKDEGFTDIIYKSFSYTVDSVSYQYNRYYY